MLAQTKSKLEKSFRQISISALFLYSQFLFKACLASTALDDAKSGLTSSATNGYGPLPADPSITSIIGKIIGTALSFVGVLFFILIVYAGVMWMTARGNEQDVTKAKELMQSAIIGLIIVLSAYAITTFISGQLGVK